MDSSIIEGAALDRLDEWGGPALVGQMIRLFLEKSPERLEMVRAALADAPGDEAERGAHQLKSAAANLGAVRIQALAADVEAAAREGEVERIRELLPALESAVGEGCAELERFLGGLEG